MNAYLQHVLAIAMIAAGFVLAFFGYGLIKLVLSVFGLFAGAAAGFLAVQAATGNVLLAALAALVAAVAGILFMKILYHVGVFAFGFICGGIIAEAMGATHGGVLYYIAGFAGAITGLAVERFIAIFITAFVGGCACAAGILHFFAKSLGFDALRVTDVERFRELSGSQMLIMLGSWFFVAMLGIGVQRGMFGGLKHKAQARKGPKKPPKPRGGSEDGGNGE